MNFTAKDVAALREKTGCGMMDCKKALTASEGDMEKAIDFLREKGLAASVKKAGRIAAEGVAFATVSEDGKVGVVIEVNAETDFVAKNADFQAFVKTCADTVIEQNPADVEALLACKAAGTEETVDALLKEKILTIGENIKIRRFARYEGAVTSYVHAGGRIGVIVKFDTTDDIAATEGFKAYAHNVAMQIAAMNAEYLDEASVPAERVEKEKEILTQQIVDEGKPQNIAEKIVAGRLNKFFKEICLVDQVYVQDSSMTVKQYTESVAKELGGDINRAIASEFAMLAAPETLPLFLRKLQRKALKQYQRREPICKGSGDIICMLDEPSSAESQAPWCKAVALALLDIAMRDQRRFAVIHFAGVGDVQTDLFLPGQYDREDVLRCAETFLNGNTDYETPLREALRLMEQEGFENADMVFVTDGECVLPDSFLEKLKAEQSARGFQITGILLDQEDAGFEFSLREFCTNVYRTSQLSRDQIAEQLVVSRVA